MAENTQIIAALSLAEILDLPADDKERHGLQHTPAEIDQQPLTWLETFEIVGRHRAEIARFLQDAGIDGVNGRDVTVSLIGAGTSDYIGRTLAPLLRQQWRCHVRVTPSTDLLTELDDDVSAVPSGIRQLWISFSRSGDSYEGVAIIEKALEKYPNIRHLIVTCNADGKMAELSTEGENVRCVVLNKRVNDQGLAMTSSFTNMIVAGHCLAHIFDLERYRPIIEALARSAADQLPAIAAAAKNIAAMDITRICFLGTGAIKAAGDESALKVLEMSAGYYSVMSESFLGLRHGPLSWLGDNSLVVGSLSNTAERRKVENGLLREIERKNAAQHIVMISPVAAESAGCGEIICLDLPAGLSDNYLPPIYVIFAQCLGLFASLEHGLKPDAPSSDGKIQRVVDNISFA